MINRTTRIITRWLKEHPEYKLSQLTAGITFDSDDEKDRLALDGADLPCTIYNDVDDECTATKYDPDKVPALVIVAELNADAVVKEGRGQLDYEQMDLALAYMERETPVINARQRGGYILTAVMDSLLAFGQPKLSRVPIPTLDPVASYAEVSETWRRLGDVEITEVSNLRESRVTGGVGKSTLIGTLLGTVHVRRVVQQRY